MQGTWPTNLEQRLRDELTQRRRELSDRAQRLGTRSDTGAMMDMYVQQAARIDDYVSAFSASDDQVGALFALNGHLFGFDLFDHPQTLCKLLPKLVRSYALDAITSPAEEFQVPPAQAARDLLDELVGCCSEVFEAVGMGQDIRLTGPRLTGAALVAERRLVHLGAFRTGAESSDGRGRSLGRLLRATQRRRNSQGSGD